MKSKVIALFSHEWSKR